VPYGAIRVYKQDIFALRQPKYPHEKVQDSPIKIKNYKTD